MTRSIFGQVGQPLVPIIATLALSGTVLAGALAPTPALAETGGDTTLTVRQTEQDAGKDEDTEQQHATVRSEGETLPQTGSLEVVGAVGLVAAGAALAAVGLASQRQDSRSMTPRRGEEGEEPGHAE